MLSAERDGWPAVRLAVFQRDKGCIAVQVEIVGVDMDPRPCRNVFGDLMEWNDWSRLEQDHVKRYLMLGRKADHDEAHLVAVCPFHHEFWATSHRTAERNWLRQHWPGIWGLTDAPS